MKSLSSFILEDLESKAALNVKREAQDLYQELLDYTEANRYSSFIAFGISHSIPDRELVAKNYANKRKIFLQGEPPEEEEYSFKEVAATYIPPSPPFYPYAQTAAGSRERMVMYKGYSSDKEYLQKLANEFLSSLPKVPSKSFASNYFHVYTDPILVFKNTVVLISIDYAYLTASGNTAPEEVEEIASRYPKWTRVRGTFKRKFRFK